jgi:hypothetical protein
MDPLKDSFLESMNSSLNNTSDDKETKTNNTNLIELRNNLCLNNNISHDNDIQINNILLGALAKTTMDEQNNKDELNQSENDNEVYYKKPIKGDTIDKKQTKLLGRKKRNDEESGEHNKFSDDNLRRKVKHLVLDNIFKFINEKIKKIYNGKIGHGIYIKKLLKINQKQISDASIQFNKDFLYKTLGDIFSEDISGNYTTYHPRHNKFLIIALTLDKDEDKKNYFKKLFSIIFVDCLKHFRGSQTIEELEGLQKFNNIKSKYEDDKEYLSTLEYYIMNYEEIINNKKARK